MLGILIGATFYVGGLASSLRLLSSERLLCETQVEVRWR